jgi:hypothetical protein
MKTQRVAGTELLFGIRQLLASIFEEQPPAGWSKRRRSD